jgi:hypothetical protein
MLTDFNTSLKNNFRKVQNEIDSISKEKEYTQELILTLEVEKNRLANELAKNTRKGKNTAFTNEALLAKDRAMFQLSQMGTDNIKKMHKFDVRSEFIQTTLGDLKNKIIMQRPTEGNAPKVPSKTLFLISN